MRSKPKDGTPDPAHDDIAYDTEGNVIDIGEAVRQKVDALLDHGDIIAMIVEVDGDVGVHVFGPPDPRVVEILEAALNGLKRAILTATAAPGRPS